MPIFNFLDLDPYGIIKVLEHRFDCQCWNYFICEYDIENGRECFVEGLA